MLQPKPWRVIPPGPPVALKKGECIAPAIPATRFLDGLSYIGDEFVGCFVLETTNGIIMMDCTCNTDHHVEVIKQGFKQLGLELTDVKYILITHGHFDHYGKCEVLRELTGAKVLMSEIDYAVAQKPTGPFPAIACVPDGYISEGDTITLGDAVVHVFLTPGHTPGALSFIFNVTDEGRPHTAAIWGGMGVTRATKEECETYIAEATRFSKLSDEYGVDVILQAHPFELGMKDKLSMIRNVFNPGIPNPFVLDRESCRRYEDYIIDKGRKALAILLKKEAEAGNA